MLNLLFRHEFPVYQLALHLMKSFHSSIRTNLSSSQHFLLALRLSPILFLLPLTYSQLHKQPSTFNYSFDLLVAPTLIRILYVVLQNHGQHPIINQTIPHTHNVFEDSPNNPWVAAGKFWFRCTLKGFCIIYFLTYKDINHIYYLAIDQIPHHNSIFYHQNYL